MKNSTRTKLLSSAFIIICLALIIIGLLINDLWVVENNIYKSILLTVCSTAASIFGLSAAWEIVCKRSFSREILNLGGVTDNYINSGIEHVYERFKDINWQIELRGVKDFTIFLSYGYTWRNYNRQILETVGKNANFTVILPDYRNSEIVNQLEKRFYTGKYPIENEPKSSLADAIKTAVYDFKSMGATVKLYDGTICSTYYLIDNKCIFAPFKHDTKKIDVPAIKCTNGGKFFEFCKNDINAINIVSTEWSESMDDK